MKKWIVLLLLFFCFWGSAEAAGHIVGVSYGVNQKGQLRVVIESDEPLPYKTKILEGEAHIFINGILEPSIAPIYQPRESTHVRTVRLQKTPKGTLIHIHTDENPTRADFKIFALKADAETKRPPRIVIDVAPVFEREYRVGGGLKGKRITLDPGHGGSDPGTHGLESGLKEKEVTLPLALRVKKLLEQKGATVYLTRYSDRDVFGPTATDQQELQARVDVAEKTRSDLFLSIHCNASTNRSVGGYSTYYTPKTPYDKNFAYDLQTELMKTAAVTDRGIFASRLYVNRKSSMPSALVECLFMTNKREEQLLLSEHFLDKIAEAIARGIEKFEEAGV
ncbi:N-acetylmuramoyl-L-alanine amidase [Acidaminococcus sp. NSJ-142]|uniref:N-acetylmuramoyl-L-alanine amidase family protein n=1 Tax=Acidaminococcus TaxID=904 RepID=UPI000CF9B115|nr:MULTISPECIES: N-acetylmuramoyl-L-alanine amidase [Acidaminococcus]MCD2436463.1 N-acetylmuramoyl-L-alanine amidase [Acidaminococcus hominis]RHJ99956.1 N-acetylmuramoyl-L-alanine amidase [Acidaminococcus sp. AM05-11]